MQLFTGTSWTDLATTAVVCISPAVGWFTFWTAHREKLREQARRRFDHLEVLGATTAVIGPWAENEYVESHHDPSWFDPTFGVFNFPWAPLEAAQ